MNRHWDPKRRFEGAALTAYQYWVIEVSWQQHTLGSCILFCKREGLRLISELTDDELQDMRDVMRAHEMRLQNRETFRPDHFNYMQTGNSLPPLHLHAIPRYATPRNAFGREWVDATWGHLPVWSREIISCPLMKEICTAFAP